MLNSTWLAYLNLCACQVQSLAFFQHPIISKKKMCLLNQENWKVLQSFIVYYPYSKVIIKRIVHVSQMPCLVNLAILFWKLACLEILVDNYST